MAVRKIWGTCDVILHSTLLVCVNIRLSHIVVGTPIFYLTHLIGDENQFWRRKSPNLRRQKSPNLNLATDFKKNVKHWKGLRCWEVEHSPREGPCKLSQSPRALWEGSLKIFSQSVSMTTNYHMVCIKQITSPWYQLSQNINSEILFHNICPCRQQADNGRQTWQQLTHGIARTAHYAIMVATMCCFLTHCRTFLHLCFRVTKSVVLSSRIKAKSVLQLFSWSPYITSRSPLTPKLPPLLLKPTGERAPKYPFLSPLSCPRLLSSTFPSAQCRR